MGRLLGRVWVGFTTCLIAFIAYSSQIFIIWPWYGEVLSVDLLKLLLPFNFLVGMLYWNYFLTVTTDPGRVPKSWEPDTKSGEGYEVKRLTGNPRYCRMCNTYKPPRTHHCRQCKTCVLRMDHHCPWVNNCVGYYNYGHFIRFLFYVDLACSYHVTMVTMRAFAAMNANYWEGPGTVEFVFMIMNYVACVPVLLGVGGFSLYHFYCMSINTTTIEGWEKDKVATLIKRGKIHEVKFPYNIGRRQNIESILGRNTFLWCWPTVPPGDGLSYRVVEEDDANAQNWPPEDPTRFKLHPDYASPDGDEPALVLPSSPWTYENGSVNPNLQPSNAYRRSSKLRARSRLEQDLVSDVPPYHPDYVGPSSSPHMSPRTREGDWYSSSSDSDEKYYTENGNKVRMGSEGYEVCPVDREEILRRYILSRGEEVGQYQRYAPEAEPQSDSEIEEGGEDNGNLPLGAEA